MEAKRTIEEITAAKSQFSEKMNKIDKFVSKEIKSNSEDPN